LGKKIHIDEVRRFAASTPVFRSKDIQLLVGDDAYALLLLHNLERRGELHRVTRGWYSTGDDPTVAVLSLAPAYLGLQDALARREMWEQQTNTVVVTTGKAKPGARRVFGETVLVHRLDPRYFFGYDYLPYGKYSVPVSDVEKTMIDLVYFGESPGREVMKTVMKKADMRVLQEYLGRYPARFQTEFRRAFRQGR
jgi:predicted transcriptional regulator of viral defense system